MINLIPPAAKKSVVREYWKRVIAVWLILFSASFVILAVFLLPTYIELRLEIAYLKEEVTASVSRVSDYDISATELVEASNQANLLLTNVTSSSPADLIDVLKKHAGSNVSLNNFNFTKLGSVPEISISGIADTRQVLAEFRDVVVEDALFQTVDLPISNLIKDKDLLFSMILTLATTTSI